MSRHIIIGFCCNECAYAAADLAGSMRREYPVNIKIIRVPCSGQVDPIYILRAFQLGADGVFVAGCLEGGCHYIDGNIKASMRVRFLKRILDRIGLNGNRLEIFLVSASDADRFVDYIRDFNETIMRIGLNPVKYPESIGWAMNKRDTTSRILKTLFNGIGLGRDRLDIVIEDPPMEFREIDIDDDKCIGCMACINTCRYDALNAIERDGELVIGYRSNKCTLCGECIDKCEYGAIKIFNGINLASFILGEEYPKVSLRLFKCESCGSTIIPERMFNATGIEIRDIYKYCVKCRRRLLSERIGGLIW